MARSSIALVTVFACALGVSAGCQNDATPVDRTALPTVAASPYICEHIPLQAVELMTGVRDPLVEGDFDLSASGGIGSGSCTIYQPDGERLKVLLIYLSQSGSREDVEERIADGAHALPDIVPGAIGSYFRRASGKNNAAYALLVRGKAELSVQMDYGAPGRDNAADVAALMKLIAPKLITDASAPSASPSPAASSEKE